MYRPQRQKQVSRQTLYSLKQEGTEECGTGEGWPSWLKRWGGTNKEPHLTWDLPGRRHTLHGRNGEEEIVTFLTGKFTARLKINGKTKTKAQNPTLYPLTLVCLFPSSFQESMAPSAVQVQDHADCPWVCVHGLSSFRLYTVIRALQWPGEGLRRKCC